MRFILIVTSIYVLLLIFKKLEMKSIGAGMLAAFISMITVNLGLFLIATDQPFAVIEGILSVGFALVTGFFMSNKVYGIKYD